MYLIHEVHFTNHKSEKEEGAASGHGGIFGILISIIQGGKTNADIYG